MGANFRKREGFYKKQFTLPVMFSIPTAITEEICLSSSPLPGSPSSAPPALQRNPVFMSSGCRHGNVVTNVSRPHTGAAQEENVGCEARLGAIVRRRRRTPSPGRREEANGAEGGSVLAWPPVRTRPRLLGPEARLAEARRRSHLRALTWLFPPLGARQRRVSERAELGRRRHGSFPPTGDGNGGPRRWLAPP